ncbi:class I SAM-dependent methyltransferase [Herminiimonas arsenitoxidans]|uniref:class I SAM-dependent methyltransferase n=1 Tax=Herminiimonas arsenitoxidans TaxID=1809410 RepID=UPI000971355D|nr:class I SAM-dependent methyltransferase [Herminiimonas arsenitoxidans]
MTEFTQQHGVREIRPKILFQQIEERNPDRNVMFNVSIPSSAIGGMTLLESSILVSLASLTSASIFFEFGTYMGATSVLLAANSAPHARITTVDLPPASIDTAKPDSDEVTLILQNDIENDNYLRRTFAEKGAFYIDRADAETQNKIKRIYHDSRSLDPQAQDLAGRFDFIFIDGGHDYDTVAIDTTNALKMAKPDAVIIWHDYRSKIHGDVTRFVDHFSQEIPLIHVQNTMLAFMLKGKFRNLLPN